MIAITTESTCDLTAQQLGYAGIETVPVPIRLEGKRLYEQDITAADLISTITRTGEAAVSLPIERRDCLDTFERALQKADTVIHLATSPGVDMQYQVAMDAAREFGGRVRVVNTGFATYALGLQALHASYLVDRKDSPEMILAALETLQQQQKFLFAVEKLDFLRINGRIGNFGAFVGNLLGIRPVIAMDGGELVSRGAPRGDKAIQVMAQQVVAFSQNLGQNVQVHTVYAPGGETVAERLRGAIASVLTTATVHFPPQPFGVAVSANGGPGTAGVVVMPAHITLPRGTVA